MGTSLQPLIIREEQQSSQEEALFPAKGTNHDRYMPGEELTSRYVSKRDKKDGVEPGSTVYTRNARYYSILKAVLKCVSEKDISDYLQENDQHDTATTFVYEQWFQKRSWELFKEGKDPLRRTQHALLNDLKRETPLSVFRERHQKDIQEYLGEKSLISEDRIARMKSLIGRNPLWATIIHSQMEAESQRLKTPLEVHLIKLDYQDPQHSFFGTGVTPGKRRASETNSARNAAEKASKGAQTPDEAARIAHKTALSVAKWHCLARWFTGSPQNQNKDALKEILATRSAEATGTRTQKIRIQRGQRENDPDLPKFLVDALWQEGLTTFENASIEDPDGITRPLLFRGGGKGSAAVADSSYLSFPIDGKPDHYQSASHLFPNLGEIYILFIRLGDRDAMGKVGQNKGFIMVGDPPKPRFFCFDIGKGWELALQMRSDCSFKQPAKSGITIRSPEAINLNNVGVLEDTAFVDKMKGMHIIRKAWGPEELKKLGIVISDEVLADYFEDTKDIQEKSHLTAFTELQNSFKEENKLLLARKTELQKQPLTADTRKEIASLDKKIAYNKEYITYIDSLREKALKQDRSMLLAVRSRLGLTKPQCAVVDGLEKVIIGPEKVQLTSKDGHVSLNYPRLEHEDRIVVDFLVDQNAVPIETEEGQYQLKLGESKETRQQAITRLLNFIDTFQTSKSKALHTALSAQRQDIIKRGIIKITPSQLNDLAPLFAPQHIKEHIQSQPRDEPEYFPLINPLFFS